MIDNISRKAMTATPPKPDREFLASDPWSILYFQQKINKEVLIAGEDIWLVKSVEYVGRGIARIVLSWSGAARDNGRPG